MIVLNASSDRNAYFNVLALPEGEVFRFSADLDFETMLHRLADAIANYNSSPAIQFEVDYIEPGNDLFYQYGANSMIVIINTGV